MNGSQEKRLATKVSLSAERGSEIIPVMLDSEQNQNKIQTKAVVYPDNSSKDGELMSKRQGQDNE